VCPDILDKFFTFILEERGPEDMLFHKEMRGFSKGKCPEK
jgi:hypothetical protein